MCGVHADEHDQPQVSLTPGATDTWHMDWNGIAGRTYFIQWSLDLISWDYAPTIDFGDDPEPYGLETEGSSKFFVRLHYIDADWITTLQEAKDADFDGDKVRNEDEVENGTDPFQSLDTDGDGMPNDWETANGFNLMDPDDATLDWDSDGNSNSQEFQQNTDPKDYASRLLPLMTIHDGDEQLSSPSILLPAPMVVRVTHSNGLPLSKVPVSLQVTTGGGLLARTPDDPQPNSTVSTYTDENGLTGVFYIQPDSLNTSSSVSATVTSGPDQSTVTFTAQTVAGLPLNDDFTNAKQLSGDEGSWNSLNLGATIEGDEQTFLTMEFGKVSPQGGNVVRQTGATVWFTWQAPQTKKYRFQTGSRISLENEELATYYGDGTDFDTVLAVYQGVSLPALTLVAGNDDSGTVESAVEFDAIAGQTYRIVTDGVEGQSGKFFLSWYPAPPSSPPANDDFSAAEEIMGTDGVIDGTTIDATEETGEPNHQFHEGFQSVWYRWQAPETASVSFDTLGSNFNTILGVYQGTTVSALFEVAWSDDNETMLAHVSFAATSGQIYWIMVDGFGSQAGSVMLTWQMLFDPPANDNFIAASSISGNSGSTTGTVRAATSEVSEPSHAGIEPKQSIWYQWTAPQTVTYTFRTTGSDFDTVLAVYTGISVNTLGEVASNDDADGLASVVSFQADQGITYYLAIDSYGGALEEGVATVLSWETGEPTIPLSAPDEPEPDPEPPPALENPLLIPNIDDQAGDEEIASDSESDEPNKGDTFVSDEDKTIVLLAPKEGETGATCQIPFEIVHSIVTTETPRARDLKGKLRLFVEGDSTLVSFGGYTAGTPINVTEPGHVGGGTHDWHRGSEEFTITGLKEGTLTLRAEVDPDPETPEGDGEPRTKAKINVHVVEADEVVIYHPATSSDADWQSPDFEVKWHRIIERGSYLKFKIVLSSAIPEDEEIDLCSVKIALFGYDDDPNNLNWIDVSQAEHRLSPDRTEVWVTVGSDAVATALVPFDSSEAEFASIEASGSGSFDDSAAFDTKAALIADSKFLVPARDVGNETDVERTVGNVTVPPFTGRGYGDYPQMGGAVYIQVKAMNTLSERRLYENEPDILYISGHGSSFDGSIASVRPGSVRWGDDLEIVIMAGCSVLDVNDYNGNYDDNGDEKTEPGPESKVFPGELWAETGPQTFLGYNYKAPLDTQGTPGIVASWFDNRASGNINAWKIANSNRAGRNACAIDAVGGTYYYFRKVGKFIKSFTWTAIPRASW